MAALEEGLARYGAPAIFNTDQGAQYTSEAFTTGLNAHGITISMDRKVRWVDNVFVERFWRSVKYEEVYPKVYESPWEAGIQFEQCFQLNNTERRQQTLNRQMPDMVCFGGQTKQRPHNDQQRVHLSHCPKIGDHFYSQERQHRTLDYQVSAAVCE